MNNRIGVIGFGKMGQLHAMAYEKLGHIVTIFDSHPIEKSKHFYISDFNEFLANIDIISICSPTHLHFEHIKICIESGKKILVEKPICSTYEQTTTINNMLQKNNTVLTVGFIERFNPAFIALTNYLNNNEISIKHITATRTNPTSGRILDADIVTDLSVHDIDLVLLLCKFSDYIILNCDYIENNGMKDEINANINIGNITADIITSRISDKATREIKIETLGGKIIICDLLNKIVTIDGNSININESNPIVDEIESFINLCNGFENSCTNIDENIKVMKLTNELSSYKK